MQERGRPPPWPRLLETRQRGYHHPDYVRSHINAQRARHLQHSIALEFKNAQRGPVNHLDLDPLEKRYLLLAASDATIGLYDMEESRQTTEDEGSPPHICSLSVTPRAISREPEALAALTGSSRGLDGRIRPPLAPSQLGGHKHSITTVQWYPFDTGLFVSGSTDATLRVWDTNTFINAGTFDLGSKLHAISMSSLMTTHALVAAGTDERRVRLCDLNSGASSHLLVGHTEGVMSVAWSPTHEHLLASGSRDRTLRLWDVRRSGSSACLLTLDMHAEHRGRAFGTMAGPTELAKAHDGWVVSVAFSLDGAWLLSAGLDNRLRKWNAFSGENTMVNFVGTRNDKSMGWEIQVMQPGDAKTAMVLYPAGSSGQVLMFPLHCRTGRSVQTLKGHLDVVQSMVYRPQAEQLITGGADSLVLLHDCSRYDNERCRSDAAEADKQGTGDVDASEDEDRWSSDNDDEEEEDEAAHHQASEEREGFVPAIVEQLGAHGRRQRDSQSSGQESRSVAAVRRRRIG